MELLKKYYFEKEKENLRLKEELNQYRTKISKHENSPLNQKMDYNTQPISCENLDDDKDFFKESLKNYDSNFPKFDLNKQKLSTLKISNNKVVFIVIQARKDNGYGKNL